MTDYSASALAPAFWKLRSFPDHAARIDRLAPDGPFQVAKYGVSMQADITPDLGGIGRGLFKVTDYYKVANGEIRERQSYYLSSGRFSLVRLSDALGATIEGALA
jgi:hypothetical protein